jgi:Bacterial Ig-like domain (group 1)
VPDRRSTFRHFLQLIKNRNNNMLQASTRTPSAALGRVAALTLIAAAVLSACGGGGGDPGAVPAKSGSTVDTGTGTGTGTTPTTPVVPATPTVTLALVGSTGQASNALTDATPLTAQATVKDASGKPVKDAFVIFSTAAEMASLSPSSGRVLTNAEGVASVKLLAANLAAAGAEKLTVTAEVGGTTIKSEGAYMVGATTLTFGVPTASPNKIPAYETTTLKVDLRAGGALYTSQPVKVNFSSVCAAAGKATLAATVSSNNGIAQAVYRDLGCANNDVITVSSDSVSAPVSATLEIAPPAASSVQFVSAAPTDKSIVIQGQGGINRTETATLKFRVFDTFGNPLPRRLVNFRVSAPTLVTLNKTSDNTDENGEVITTVNSGSAPTSFRVFATLPNTATGAQPDISTTSDSIVVTSGLPTQRAFSVSAGKVNLESFSESNPSEPATHVQVMIADAFGNPVPDGTPVVFQTNMGSVGSADKGGCITVNGGCQVDFRMQEPRVATPGLPATPCNTGTAPGVSPDSTRPGLATVCASTTDGTNTIFSKIALFFSGSRALNVFMNGSTTPLSLQNATDLGSAAAADSKVFVLQLNDGSLNPLPVGTKVEVTNLVNASAEVTPAVVQNVFPHTINGDDVSGNNVAGAQGSYHTFTIANPAGQTCTGPVTATFNVTVTTPAEIVTTIPFKLAFSCP